MEQQQEAACPIQTNTQSSDPQQVVMPEEPEICRLIHQGDAEGVLRLMQTGDVDPNHITKGGWSLLHMAALGDMADVVGTLIDAGANVEAEDAGGLRPIHYAVSWDAQEALSKLLQRGASINPTSKDQLFYLNKIIPVFVVGGRTPLHFAADKGYFDCAKLLLEAGADTSIIDWSGRTAYDLAVNNNRLDIASLLRPGVEEHVVAVPKDFHFDRRGVETRLGRKAPLPSLRPPTLAPASSDNSDHTTPPSASSSTNNNSTARMSLLDDMLRQATALLPQPSPATNNQS